MSDRKPLLLVESNPEDRDLFSEAYQVTGLAHDLIMGPNGEEALRLLHPSSLPSAVSVGPAAVVLE